MVSGEAMVGAPLEEFLIRHFYRAPARAIERLPRSVDPAAFAEKFGAPIQQLDSMVAQKTVTVAKLMEVAPSGTPDPSSTLYNSTMFVMGGLLVIALVANARVRRLDSKYHLGNSP